MNGAERIFAVNARREVHLVQGEELQRQVVHDHLKAKFGQIPPDDLLDEAVLL